MKLVDQYARIQQVSMHMNGLTEQNEIGTVFDELE